MSDTKYTYSRVKKERKRNTCKKKARKLKNIENLQPIKRETLRNIIKNIVVMNASIIQ